MHWQVTKKVHHRVRGHWAYAMAPWGKKRWSCLTTLCQCGAVNILQRLSAPAKHGHTIPDAVCSIYNAHELPNMASSVGQHAVKVEAQALTAFVQCVHLT